MLASIGKTVFIVDDEKIIADTLALILKHHGYDAQPFYSAESAVLAGEVSVPELLISDVVMPAMSGADLAIYFTKRHPNCKILLFSGQANTAYLLKKAEEEGYCFELLSKPVHPTDLLERLRNSETELTRHGSMLRFTAAKEIVK